MSQRLMGKPEWEKTEEEARDSRDVAAIKHMKQEFVRKKTKYPPDTQKKLAGNRSQEQH